MKKDILIIAVIVLAISTFFAFSDIKTPEKYYTEHIEDISKGSKTASVVISCENALKSDRLSQKVMKVLPKNGIIASGEFVIRNGDTAFDILSRVIRKNEIQFEYQGSDESSFNSVYIEGINFLYEFECGDTSGWMFRINGRFPEKSCSQIKINNGDCVELIYSLNLGKDCD